MTMNLTQLRAATLAACLATTLGAAAAATASWMQPAYDGAQTWNNPKETLLKPGNVGRLHRLSSQEPGINWASQPSQAGGSMFLCTDAFGLGAIDAATGALRWSSVAAHGSCSGVVLSGANLYASAWRDDAGVWTNTLTAMSQADGALRWQAVGPADPGNGQASWLTFNVATLSQGTLFVSHGRSLVSAYDATNGQLRWRAETGSLNNPVAAADGYAYTTTWAEGQQPNRVYAHRAADGTLAWSQPVDGSQYPATVAGGRVFVASTMAVHAFDAAAGTPLWSQSFAGYVAAQLAVTSQSVFVDSAHATLVALDPATGATQWTTHLRGTDGVASNLVVAGNVLYAVTKDFGGTMRLAAFDARSGKQLLRSSDTWSGSYANLSVAGGRVVVTDNGNLSTYGL
jgi:outer membrane protein assembly factor BamB